MPDRDTAALNLTCAECGRSPRAGETWRLMFADISEVVIYCPACAAREQFNWPQDELPSA
jgi:hypothetical protein